MTVSSKQKKQRYADKKIDQKERKRKKFQTHRKAQKTFLLQKSR